MISENIGTVLTLQLSTHESYCLWEGGGRGQVIFDICIEYKLCRAFQKISTFDKW